MWSVNKKISTAILVRFAGAILFFDIYNKGADSQSEMARFGQHCAFINIASARQRKRRVASIRECSKCTFSSIPTLNPDVILLTGYKGLGGNSKF